MQKCQNLKSFHNQLSNSNKINLCAQIEPFCRFDTTINEKTATNKIYQWDLQKTLIQIKNQVHKKTKKKVQNETEKFSVIRKNTIIRYIGL